MRVTLTTFEKYMIKQTLYTCHIYVWILLEYAQKERIRGKRKGNPLSYPLYEKK